MIKNCPISFNNGWYEKEVKDDKWIIYSTNNSSLIFNDITYNYIELVVRYDGNESIKVLDIVMDGMMKKPITLVRNISQTITLSIIGLGRLDFITKSSGISFVLEKVSLVKGLEKECLDIQGIPSNSKIKKPKVKPTIYSNQADIKVESNTEFSGIMYVGQYGTCGYATAAKGNLFYFLNKGIPISWTPFYFDDSELNDDCFYNITVKSLINKVVPVYDTVIIHLTPDLWPEFVSGHKMMIEGKRVIGYMAWESSRLPNYWVKCINSTVEEVWCPSTYNKEVFKNSGVKIPIKVFPHIFLPKELPNRKLVSLNDSKYYTFYNISELNFRKGVEDLVKVFCDTFTSKDKVRLILKIHYRNYDEQSKKHCVDKLNTITSKHKHPPRIRYILNNLSEKEMLGLHSIGDCYVSLCKSEGFGLTIFEAFKYGKKVITTGYGGQIDFLGKDYEGLVKYKLDSITGMEEFSKNYTKDQLWAYPDLKHAGELMKDLYVKHKLRI